MSYDTTDTDPPMEQIRVNAITIRCGDRVYLHGRERQVRDMRTVRGGRKRLILDGSEAYLLGAGRFLPARRPLPRAT